MTWKPPLRPGLLYGAIYLLAPLLLLLLAVGALLWRELDPLTVLIGLAGLLLLAFVALVARAFFGLLSLGYGVDDEGLVIQHGGKRHVLPTDTILELKPAPPLGVVRVGGLSWPGYKVGIARVPRMGRARFFITSERPADTLLIRTGAGLWVISPADRDAFLAEWEARRGGAGGARAVRPAASIAPPVTPAPPRPEPPVGDLDEVELQPGERLRIVPRAPGDTARSPVPVLNGLPVETPAAADEADETTDRPGRDAGEAEPLRLRSVEPAAEGRPLRRIPLDAANRVDAPGRRHQPAPSLSPSAAGRSDGAALDAAEAPFEAGEAAPAGMAPLTRLLIVAAALNLALYVFVGVRYPVLADGGQMPIHYNAQGGVDRLADPIWAFYFPFMGTAILLVNAALAWALRDRDPLVPLILLGSTLFLQAVVFITALTIVG